MKKTKKVAPPLIFIHGAGGGSWEWDYWKNYFQSYGYDCIAPSLTGQKKQLAQVHFQDYVQELITQLDAMEQKPFILGASMGGLLAQKIAETMNLAGLILINSVAPKHIADMHGGKYNTPERRDIIPWRTQSSLQDTARCMPEADKKTILWAHTQWRDESGSVIRDIRNGVCVKRPKKPTPTLVIAGNKDTEIHPLLSHHIATYYRADHFVFDGVSHVGALLGKHWEKIATITRSWIEAHGV